MIFSTLNQFNCFVSFLFFGILVGLIYNLFCILFCKKYLNFYQKNIFFCIFSAFFIVFFTFLKNYFNFGIFSLSLFAFYFMGFLWCCKLLKNLVVFFSNKWYTLLKKHIFIKKEKKNESQQS